MSLDISNQIASSLQSQGRGTQEGVETARNSYLEQMKLLPIPGQEDENELDFAEGLQLVNEAVANKSFEEATEIRTRMWGMLQRTSDYQGLSGVDQEQIRNGYMTQLTAKGQQAIESLDPNDPNNKYVLESYNQYQSLRSGKEVDLSGWDTFGKSILRNSATAGMGLLAVDAASERDIRKSMLGTEAGEMDKILYETATRFAPGEAADLKRGKVFGTIVGIGVDVAASFAFGAVTGLTKAGLSMGANAAAKIGTGSVMARTAGAATKFLIPNTLEASLFIVEDTVYKTVNNELDINGDLAEIARGVPGSFLKGLVYAAGGQLVLGGIAKTLGRGARSAAEGLEKVGVSTNKYERRAVRAITKEVKSGTLGEGQKISRELLRDLRVNKWTPETDAVRLKRYIDEYQWAEEDAFEVVTKMREAAFLADPDKWVNEAEHLRSSLVHGWGADVEYTKAGDLQFKRFMNADMPNGPVTVSPDEASLAQFFKDHSEGNINEFLDQIRLSRGMHTGSVGVDLTAPGAKTRSIQLDSAAVSRTFNPADEVTRVDDVQKMIDNLLPGTEMKVQRVSHADFYQNYQPKEGILQIPETVTTKVQAQQYADKFFQQVSEGAEVSGKKLSISSKNIKKYLGTGKDVKYDVSFFKKIKSSVKIQEEGKQFKAVINGDPFVVDGNVQLFATKKEAINEVASRLHVDSFGGLAGVQEVLGRRGITLKAKAGKIEVSINGDRYGTFDKLSDVFKDPSLKPGIPKELRPQFLELSTIGDGMPHKMYKNTGVGIEGTLGNLDKSSTVRQMSQDFKGYEDIGNGMYKVKDSGIDGVDVFTDGGQVTIRVPETGFVKDFNSVDEASAYLKDFKNRYGNIRNRASDQGMVVRATETGWLVANNVEKNYFRNMDEVERFLGRDSITSVRDMVSPYISREAYRVTGEAVDDVLGKVTGKLDADALARAAKAKSSKGSAWRQIKDNWMKQTHGRIRDTGDIEAMRVYNSLQSSYRAMDAENIVIKNKLDGIFKGYSTEEIHFAGMVMAREGGEDTWPTVIKKMNEEMKTDFNSDKLIPMLNKSREMFDQGGVLFGVSGKRWYKDYAPRLADKDMSKLFDVGADDILEGGDKYAALLKRDIPPQDVPFFFHARTNEMGNGMMDTNLRNMVEQYYNIGNRSVYMKSPMDQIRTYARGEGVNDSNLIQLKQMIDSINGRVVDTPSATAAHNLNELKRAKKVHIVGGEEMLVGPDGKSLRMEEVFQKAVGDGKDFGRMAQDIESVSDKASANKVFSSLVNGALMAWNMRMPVRNVGQIFTNLSPVMGARTTNRAFIDVLGSKTLRKRLYDEGIENGVLQPFSKTGKITNVGKTIDAYANTGMYIFRKSDDLTRLVSMRASEIRAEAAIDAFKGLNKKNGKLTEEALEKFRMDTHMDFLDESVQARLLGMVTGKNSATGVLDEKGIKALLGREITTMTMYDYTPHIRPEKFKGGIGNIMGKMGTWPVAYFDLFKRGIAARGAGFVTRIALAQAAMGVLYNDVLDMNGVPYTPLGNMAFTGGPAFEGFPKAIQGATKGISGVLNGNPKQGAKDLIKGTSWFMPGYKQGKSLVKGIQAMQEGEYWDSGMYLMGANPDWNQPGLSRFYKNLEPEQDYNLESWVDAIKFPWLK